MKPIEFYFDYRSPYSYLASTQLAGLGAPVEFHPMDVLDVMKRVNNTPTTITCAVKGRYAGADLTRWVARYGVPFARHPDAKDIEGRRLLRATLAVAADRRGEAAAALFKARWGVPAPLATAAEVAAVLAAAGIDIDPARIDGAELDAVLDAASEQAADRGVFGAPTFFVGGEMFFGNDRLDFLREALVVGA